MAGLVQIRDVPDDARRALKARAAARGESFNEFLRKLLIEEAARPTVREVLERARSRSERSDVSSVDVIRADRDGRS
jgi:plasmid stability protein